MIFRQELMNWSLEDFANVDIRDYDFREREAWQEVALIVYMRSWRLAKIAEAWDLTPGLDLGEDVPTMDEVMLMSFISKQVLKSKELANLLGITKDDVDVLIRRLKKKRWIKNRTNPPGAYVLTFQGKRMYLEYKKQYEDKWKPDSEYWKAYREGEKRVEQRSRYESKTVQKNVRESKTKPKFLKKSVEKAREKMKNSPMWPLVEIEIEKDNYDLEEDKKSILDVLSSNPLSIYEIHNQVKLVDMAPTEKPVRNIVRILIAGLHLAEENRIDLSWDKTQRETFFKLA